MELGCGSGRLWENLHLSKLKSYRGIDFSQSAISQFKEKSQGNDQTILICEESTENIYPADIVVSLGLFDWLPLEKISKMVRHYRNSWYLHSFSEKSLSLSQILHSLYVFINYGYKDVSYTPRYYKASHLLEIFGDGAKIYRHKKLKFGAFIHNLPDHVQFKI